MLTSADMGGGVKVKATCSHKGGGWEIIGKGKVKIIQFLETILRDTSFQVNLIV